MSDKGYKRYSHEEVKEWLSDMSKKDYRKMIDKCTDGINQVYIMALQQKYWNEYKSIIHYSNVQYRSATESLAYIYSEVCIKLKIDFSFILNYDYHTGLTKPKRVNARINMENMEILYPTIFREVEETVRETRKKYYDRLYEISKAMNMSIEFCEWNKKDGFIYE